MSDPTFEEARRCPKCQQPGRDQGFRTQRNGSKIHTIACHNGRCVWNNTTWIVQVNADGSIPEPTLDRDKSFPKLPERSDEAMRNQFDRLYEQTLNGGETR
jgi:hypothetical protein